MFRYSPIEYSPYLSKLTQTDFYIKREDLIPFGGGGNKARIVRRLLDDAKKQQADVIVTAGGPYSNFNRALALTAIPEGFLVKIILIQKEEPLPEYPLNKKICDFMGVEFIESLPEKTSDTIRVQLEKLEAKGSRPYFIYGGGHTSVGCEAYLDSSKEILEQLGFVPNLIATPLATGTTFTGLLAGSKIHLPNTEILGISVAREKRQIIANTQAQLGSIHKTQGEVINFSDLENQLVDGYTCGGYGKKTPELEDFIQKTMVHTGLLLDPIYSGKGLFGLTQHLRQTQKYQGKKVVFLHTGGVFNFASKGH
ncbi:pyridoxal-phosphate dependent enzyme [Algoriphagus lacus]|uniref:Pyridoxal-phosphate dependent enzyme n=1 Tax=Algoriphagus lacus TaxID=2056311 RepID=A0A418PPG6_9BACT|nr:pyridoxal-phosphate dependent enzyme [Algoriphagus lacus]RIW13973.1 pyridoxal-phosphate dependent enzyme [Algoriphagus lacus]